MQNQLSSAFHLQICYFADFVGALVVVVEVARSMGDYSQELAVDF
jgi:hypothetical protein